MQFLAFVELGVDTPAQGLILEVAEDEQRFDQPLILLEELGQLALTRIGLQATDEQRSGDIPACE
jgi:acetolactate synthase small subunit